MGIKATKNCLCNMDLDRLDCEKCGQAMKKIAAGTSYKTGEAKPYSEFWVCDTKRGGCGATFNPKRAEKAPESPTGASTRGLEDRLDETNKLLDALVTVLQDIRDKYVKSNSDSV